MFDSLPEPEDNPRTAKWLLSIGLVLLMYELFGKHYNGKLHYELGVLILFLWATSWFLRRW